MLVAVSPSLLSGKGVFALQDFSAGDFILTIKGEIVEVEDPLSLPQDTLEHTMPIECKNGLFRFIIHDSVSRYLNHSCDPNAGLKNTGDVVEVVAIRSIKKGEEILIDYAMCNIDDFQMKCSCGSSLCRGKVVSFEELDKETQKKYYPYVLDYIRKK